MSGKNNPCALATLVCVYVLNLLERIKKNLLLTESLSDEAETYCSVPYIARPSYWQDGHSGETRGKCFFILNV